MKRNEKREIKKMGQECLLLFILLSTGSIDKKGKIEKKKEEKREYLKKMEERSRNKWGESKEDDGLGASVTVHSPLYHLHKQLFRNFACLS